MNVYNKIVWGCGAMIVLLAGSVMLGLFPSEPEAKNASIDLLVGTYGENIHRYVFDTETLSFEFVEKAEANNASYVIRVGDAVYAVSETGDASGVYSFAESDSLVLTADMRQTGADPCFIMAYDEKVLTADYSGGSVSVFPVCDNVIGDCIQKLEFDGKGPVADRQESSHIHQLKQIPGKEWILASDLGADVIRLLGFNEGQLVHETDIPCPPGSGPRHMEFNDDASCLYCIAELSGDVIVYDVNLQGDVPQFTMIQTIQADEVNAGGSADIHMHPEGKCLYTSHRLENDGISVFSVNADGTLTKTGYARTGRHPRNFMITPDGKHLLVACMNDRFIQVFEIGEDGALTLTASSLTFDSDRPSSITF